VTFKIHEGEPREYNYSDLAYSFQPATPVPEPATLVLFGSPRDSQRRVSRSNLERCAQPRRPCTLPADFWSLVDLAAVNEAAPVNAPSPIENDLDGVRIDPVLFDEDARRERLDGVIVTHRH
jgi:hypothetical protein